MRQREETFKGVGTAAEPQPARQSPPPGCFFLPPPFPALARGPPPWIPHPRGCSGLSGSPRFPPCSPPAPSSFLASPSQGCSCLPYGETEARAAGLRPESPTPGPSPSAYLWVGGDGPKGFHLPHLVPRTAKPPSRGTAWVCPWSTVTRWPGFLQGPDGNFSSCHVQLLQI